MDADPVRIEEAGLNALQTQRQLFFDGWLLRLSPGTAKRARSVNAHFGSSLPLDAKIDRCERLYAAHRLPALFRITPWSRPRELDAVLERRGYAAFDETLVQVAPTAPLHRPERMSTAGPPQGANSAPTGGSAAAKPQAWGDHTSTAGPPQGANSAPTGGSAAAKPQAWGDHTSDIECLEVPIAAFVEAVGALRGSPVAARNAHLERLAHSPLATHAIVARADGRTLACGQVAFDGDDWAGIYDMVTAIECRGRGLATAIVDALLAHARKRGVARAFLQVSDDNAAALAVYRKFGFKTAYTYHYRARAAECV